MDRKPYRARDGRIVRVGPVTVTDAPEGVLLANTPAVRDHVRCGRLLEVIAPVKTKVAKDKEVKNG